MSTAKKAPAKKRGKKTTARVVIVATIPAEVVEQYRGLGALADWLSTLVSLDTGHGLDDIAVSDDLDDLVSDVKNGHEALVRYPASDDDARQA
jgi:hypothetical protein